MLRNFHIGVDLGQRRDYTAVVVVEQRIEPTGAKDSVTYEKVWRRRLIVRKAARLKLGTEFHRIVNTVAGLTMHPALEGKLVTTAIDATGMGLVVTEQLQMRRLRGELYPVVITGGVEMKYRAGFYPTPRTDILLGVVQAFEVDQLEVASEVKGWEVLVEELRSMRKTPGVGGPRFESEGQHDDMVFALGLALVGFRQRVLPVDGKAVRRWAGFGEF
jgi:hypothetical protein